jgi:hypothetical protein
LDKFVWQLLWRPKGLYGPDFRFTNITAGCWVWRQSSGFQLCWVVGVNNLDLNCVGINRFGINLKQISMLFSVCSDVRNQQQSPIFTPTYGDNIYLWMHMAHT